MRSEIDSGSRTSNIRRIAPLRCRMWDMHDRLGEQIDDKSCASLIESIEKHGQRHPVLGRFRPDADGYEIELIYGARRLFAAQHLGIALLVEVRDINDRDSAIEMHIENRGRKDTCPYERGLSYARWLRAGLFKTQGEIAAALGLSEGRISRLLRYAELPAVVVDAFESGCDIREDWATVLARQCGDPTTRETVLRRARAYAHSGKREVPQRVYDALVGAPGRKLVSFSKRDEVVKDSTGCPVARLQFRAKTVHVVLSRSDLEVPALRSAVRAMATSLELAREGARRAT